MTGPDHHAEMEAHADTLRRRDELDHADEIIAGLREEVRSWRRVAERLETETQELLSVCDCEIRDQTNNRQTSDKRSAAYAEGALRVANGIAHRIREKSEARR